MTGEKKNDFVSVLFAWKTMNRGVGAGFLRLSRKESM